MRIENHGPVACMHLEAGRANAMGPEFLDNLLALFDAFEASSARAAVLVGYERFFSAGLALPHIIDCDRPQMRAFISKFNQAMQRVFMLDKPLVAAINGHAIAGGCVLAMQADYRLMAAGKSRIGLSEVTLGVGLPGLVVETLRARVPTASMSVIALEGRLLAPDAAHALGLVEEVVAAEELLPRALKKARELAELPSLAFAQVKASLRAPYVERAQARVEADTEAWLDTWFCAEARTRIAQVVADLQSRG